MTRKNAASRRTPIQFLGDEASRRSDADGAEAVHLTADTPEENEESSSEMNGNADSDVPISDDIDYAEVVEVLDPDDYLDADNDQADKNQNVTPLTRDSSGIDPAGTTARQNQPPTARLAGDASAGPVIAELIATRAELRRVEGELQKVGGEMEKADQERTELTEAKTRLQADFDNFRKRTERSRGEVQQTLVAEITNRLLPIADNFRRAIETTAEIEKSEEFKHFTLGIELIRKQLDDVLTSYGVEPVPAVGEIFDPHVHEAIATEKIDGVPPNTITEEVVRGYRLGDKLLRPAMVKVAAP